MPGKSCLHIDAGYSERHVISQTSSRAWLTMAAAQLGLQTQWQQQVHKTVCTSLCPIQRVLACMQAVLLQNTDLKCMRKRPYQHLLLHVPAAVPSAPAAAVAAGPPWWSSFNQQLASTRQHLARVATDLQVASKSWKAPDLSKGLGVKLDIDMLSPAVSTVKQQYQALPEPVRDVMPFAGALIVCTLVFCRI